MAALIPAVATPDQPRIYSGIYGTPVSHSVAPKLFDKIYPALGFPRFSYRAKDTKTLDDPANAWSTDAKRADTVGTCVTMPLKVEVMQHMDALTPAAIAVGSVNTTFFTADGKHVGTNTDVSGVYYSLLTPLTGLATPFPAGTAVKFAKGKAAGFMIGGGGAARAAVFAMKEIGLSPILLINRDQDETAAIIKQFPDIDLRDLASLEYAKTTLLELKATGTSLCAGVGAIPSIEPSSAAEKLVYEIATLIFSSPLLRTETPADSLSIPSAITMVEMAYKPRMTIMRTLAESLGVNTVCGVEVVLEGCFEQAKIWTGQAVKFEVREEGRALLKAE